MRKVAENSWALRTKREAAVSQVQIVTFRLGPEEFGLDVSSVHEVLRYEPVTPVPRAPDFVEGVAEVRGAFVPVIDLRRRFELARIVIGLDTRIVVAGFKSERIGLIVDAVTAVLRIPEVAVAPSPDYFRGISAEFIQGIARLEDRLIILIDIERVLSSAERIALEEADLVPDPSTRDDSPEEE